MAAYLAKPVSPQWQPGSAPAGCKLYLPLAEGAAKTVRDLARAHNGTFVGAPAWQRGLYGPQLGGFSTSDYVAIDPPSAILGTGTYPCWCAAMFVNTTASSGWLISQGSTTDGNAQIGLRLNNATADRVEYVNGTSPTYVDIVVDGILINDGNPHVAMGVSWSASSHQLFIDGISRGTDSTTPSTFTGDALSLGVFRGSSVSGRFPGSLVWAGCGNGSVPSPLAIYADLLAGQFSAVRPRSRLAVLAATSGGTPPATIYARRGRSFRVGSRGVA